MSEIIKPRSRYFDLMMQMW